MGTMHAKRSDLHRRHMHLISVTLWTSCESELQIWTAHRRAKQLTQHMLEVLPWNSCLKSGTLWNDGSLMWMFLGVTFLKLKHSGLNTSYNSVNGYVFLQLSRTWVVQAEMCVLVFGDCAHWCGSETFCSACVLRFLYDFYSFFHKLCLICCPCAKMSQQWHPSLLHICL